MQPPTIDHIDRAAVQNKSCRILHLVKKPSLIHYAKSVLPFYSTFLNTFQYQALRTLRCARPMSYYTLSIGVYGDGEDPNHRSHWGFLIFSPGSEVGNLLHVQLISLQGLIYQFETRSGHPLESQTCEGRVLLGYIESTKYNQVVKIISEEPAPRNNKVRTQLLMTEHNSNCCRIGVRTGLLSV
jgi:hypothetical protein